MVLFYTSSQPAYCCQGNFSNLNTECIPQIFSFGFKRERCQLPESIKKSFSSWYTLNIQCWMITAKLFILLDTHQSELDGPSWGFLLRLSILLLSSIVTFQFCYFPVLLLSILLLSSFVTVQNCYFPVLIFSSCDAFLLSSLDQFPPFHASALQSTDCSRCEGGSRINQSFEERVRVEKFSHAPRLHREYVGPGLL